MKWVKRFLQEPLLHFLLLAGLLFLVSYFWKNETRRNSESTILVSEAKILSLAQIWRRTWQRSPTRQELEGVIDDYIREEVLYREAQVMGLDRDDTIIRRRLRQKLEFVAEELADAIEPSDEELQAFLESHPDQFRLDQAATFQHVFLSPASRGSNLDDDAQSLLQELREAEPPVDPTEFGDRFLLPHAFENLSEREMANTFGLEFPQQLLQLAPGRWMGPIESGYGVHLVLVDSLVPGRLPELSEVRKQVRLEWFAAQRAKSKEKFYEGLRQQYDVVIQWPELATDPAAAAGQGDISPDDASTIKLEQSP